MGPSMSAGVGHPTRVATGCVGGARKGLRGRDPAYPTP
jgi:hypothetical protein